MTSPSSETDRTRKGRWQFSLRKLLLLLSLVAITLGLVSWKLSFALLFVILASSLLTFEALIRQRLSLIGLAGRVLLILFVAALFPSIQPGRPMGRTAVLAFRVLDARTKQPITNAHLILLPNGNRRRPFQSMTNGSGESRIEASFSATYREVGWGRFKFDAILAETELDVSAQGYVSATVYWKDLSQELIRPADAPPGPPVEILLQPLAVSH